MSVIANRPPFMFAVGMYSMSSGPLKTTRGASPRGISAFPGWTVSPLSLALTPESLTRSVWMFLMGASGLEEVLVEVTVEVSKVGFAGVSSLKAHTFLLAFSASSRLLG